MNAVSLGMFQVFEVVHSQDLMVGQIRLHLDNEEGSSASFELLLQANERRDVLVIGSDMVQEGDDTLAVDRSLDPCVARVECVLTKPTQNRFEQ